MLYVLARTISGGRRDGVLSSTGTFLGGLVHVFAAAAGLSVVLATSAIAFTIVKFLGAGYLIYLGIRMLAGRGQADSGTPSEEAGQTTNRPFWQGIATEVLNPKTALFFLSFIPQFVSRSTAHAFWEFAILGGISVAMNTSADLAIVLLAGPIGRGLRSSQRLRRRQQKATGLTMIALGTYVAFGESN